MKGYYKPRIPFEAKIVKERIYVGCNRCRTTWFEEKEIVAGMPRINSASLIYDYCDNCITDVEKAEPTTTTEGEG